MEHFFTRFIFSILFCAFNFYASLAQPTDCVPNSGSDATIIFGQGVVPKLNGNPLPAGAYIVAVFNSSGVLKCAGYNQWQNMPMSISPKGANTGFEGYASGETYKFRIILPGGDVIQNDKITVAFKSPDGILCLNGNTFVADGISCIQSFQAINSESFLTVSPANINVSASAGSSTASVTSNINWSASSNAGWVSISPTSGSNNGTLNLTYQQNSSTQSRVATISVSGIGITTKTITLTQEGASSVLSLNPTSLNLPATQGNTTVSINSNIAWTASSNASWLTLTPGSGTNNGTLTVNYQANTSAQSRTATITVSGSGVSSQTVNVTQAGTSPSQPFTTVWNIPSGASTLSFYIQTVGTTSYSWTAGTQSGSGTWGTTNGQVTINVSATANNTPLSLSISPDNLKRFYNLRVPENPSIEKLINVTNWGTVKWSSMEQMFSGCINLNITGTPAPPNLDNVTDMSGMFSDCHKLNGPSNIGSWNTSNVSDMSAMFDTAFKFNQSLNNWNVSKVTDMKAMFQQASSFNQPLNNWNVSNVTDMSFMLSGTFKFNQPLNNWNVSNVTDMSWIFQNASEFNQPLNNWNVLKVTNMSGMFFGTSIFNQPLGTWKLNPNVRFFESFSEVGLFNESGMNCDNYSATLIGWQQNNPNVKGRAMLATGLRYGTNAVAARNALINTQNWQISGDLPSGTLCGSSSTDDKNEENVLKIYPNPSTGKISIKSDFKDVKNIEIRGLDGRIVQVISELKDNEIDLSNLAPGSYILRGLVNNNPFARKVVILR